MGQNVLKSIRLQDFLINHIFRTNQWNSLIFLHIDTNSNKVKVDQKVFEWAQWKMGMASLVMELQIWLSQEWVDVIDVKVISISLGWVGSKIGMAI